MSVYVQCRYGHHRPDCILHISNNITFFSPQYFRSVDAEPMDTKGQYLLNPHKSEKYKALTI